MESAFLDQIPTSFPVEPLCPVFGSCGGCLYQHLPYEEELRIKESQLRRILEDAGLPVSGMEAVVPSPDPYHYRHRLDIGIYRRRDGGVVMGFRQGRRRTVEIESCAIARPEVSAFLPELRKQAEARMPPKYRTANLVVRTGDDGRVVWGGIGRRSLRMKEEDYLYTDIHGRRIFYGMETFFQANLGILPILMDRIRQMSIVEANTLFLDLYAGVGLFGLCLADQAGRVLMIEDCQGSVEMAKYNIAWHRLEERVEFIGGRVEDHLERILKRETGFSKTAMIDPPRRGLSESVRQALIDAVKKESAPEGLEHLLYLSCSPESLARDLRELTAAAWKIKTIIPFDFFPKTQHLETLVLLEPAGNP